MDDMSKHWDQYAEEKLVGRTIVAAAYMTKEEVEQIGFRSRPLCIVFDDGTTLIPQRDDEGNDAGALCGIDPEDQMFTLPVLR